MSEPQSATYRAAERSDETTIAFGYIFHYGSAIYHLCRFDQDIDVTGLPAAKGSDPETFEKAAINHAGQEKSVELTSPVMNIAVAISATSESEEFQKHFLQAVESDIKVEVFRINKAALANENPSVVYGTDTFTIFRGDCESITFRGYEIHLQFRSIISDPTVKVPRFKFQKTCQHRLGDQRTGTCQVDLEVPAHRIVTTIAAIDRSKRTIDITETTLNAVAITDKTFDTGKVYELDGPGGSIVNRITIQSCEVLPASAGTRLRLMWLPTSLQVGTDIRVYRGCHRHVTDCNDVFSNLDNFGGMPYIPVENPSIEGVSA